MMTDTEVSLTFTEEERELVQELLEEQHRTLLIEISHTDHHHFKGVLLKKVALLESALSRFMVQV
jgi:hypothetical protein